MGGTSLVYCHLRSALWTAVLLRTSKEGAEEAINSRRGQMFSRGNELWESETLLETQAVLEPFHHPNERLNPSVGQLHLVTVF